MDKKKLTPKEIFRTLTFHYHYDEKIPLDIICEMVSAIYYPKDPTGDAQKRYKSLLMMMMKEHTNGQKTINEAQFVQYMREMSKLKNDEYSLKLTKRIFERYARVDPDSKEKVICQVGFKEMSKFLGIREQQVLDYFHSVSDRKNQITFQMFNDYMNSLLVIDQKKQQKKKQQESEQQI